MLDEKPGSNLTPDAFASWAMKALTLKREAAEANGRYRAYLKKGEADLGVDLKVFADIIRLRALESPERDQRLRRTLEYAAWLSMPIGTQTDLFSDALKQSPGDKMAREVMEHGATEAGYASGKAGQPRETNPHPLGTPVAAAWARGWIDGHAIYEAAKAERPDPKPRGRPKGSGKGKPAAGGPLPLTASQREAAAEPSAPMAETGSEDAIAAGDTPTGANVVDFLARSRAHLGDGDAGESAEGPEEPSLAASLPEAEPADGAAVTVGDWLAGGAAQAREDPGQREAEPETDEAAAVAETRAENPKRRRGR